MSLAEGIELLGAGIEKLLAVDPSMCVDAELADSTVALAGLGERFALARSHIDLAWQRSGEWQGQGHRSPAALLAARANLSPTDTRARMRLALQLDHMPHAAAAVASGALSMGHVRALAGVRNERTAAALERDEQLLVDKATELTFGQFRRLLSHWLLINDPDGPDPDGREGRRVHLSQNLDRTWALDGLLDPIGGEVFLNQLQAIESELFDQDWAEARERFGDRTFALTDLSRTPAQRRADALVEMARRSATAPKDGQRPEPEVIVLIDEDDFVEAAAAYATDGDSGHTDASAETLAGTPLPAHTAVEAAIAGHVRRAVRNGDGVILDFGRKVRLFRGALRRALAIQYRTCAHPDCELPAIRCEMDHIVPWERGGTTSIANGRPYCRWHHRNRTNHTPF